MAYPNGQERQGRDMRVPGGTGDARPNTTQRDQGQGNQVAAAALNFRRAVKEDAKLRFAVCGPSGSGKTFTLLRVATELGGPIALVDTERGSASKYADLFEFDVLELDSYDPARLIEIVDFVAVNGYRVLCIDSLSHFWMGKDGELEQVDRAARRMPSQNSFAAWKHVTPIHNRLIDRIISAPLHILVSMRSKTEWVLEKDEKTGKTAPRKLGLAPVMRDGIEYEFDVCGDMDHENTLTITKSRCPTLTGGAFSKPGRELADALKIWLSASSALSAGEPEQPKAAGDRTSQQDRARGDQQRSTKPGSQAANEPAKQEPYAVSDEIASMWRRMCSPRGVLKEFEELKAGFEKIAGSTGVAEFHRILREHGVERARDFTSIQPARMCARDVFAVLEQLREQARENQEPLVAGDGAPAENDDAQEVK